MRIITMEERLRPDKNNVLIKRPTRHWQEEAYNRTPDGIRDSDALHLLLFFKYEEPVCFEDIQTSVIARFNYLIENELDEDDLEVFLISTTPLQYNVLNEWGYKQTDIPGVYRSSDPLCEIIPIIFPGELKNTPNNALLKVIVSPKNERMDAFETINAIPTITKKVSKELNKLKKEAENEEDYFENPWKYLLNSAKKKALLKKEEQ